MVDWIERLSRLIVKNPRAAINVIFLLSLIVVGYTSGKVVVFLFDRSDNRDLVRETEQKEQVTELNKRINYMQGVIDKLTYQKDSASHAHYAEMLAAERENTAEKAVLLKAVQTKLDAIEQERLRSARKTSRNENLLDEAIKKAEEKL